MELGPSRRRMQQFKVAEVRKNRRFTGEVKWFSVAKIRICRGMGKN